MTRATNDKRLRVLISGGAGSVGLACASALAERGAELILCDTDTIALANVSQQLGAFARSCDAVDEASVAMFAAEVDERFSGIDVLINAAGRNYVRALGMMRVSLAFMPLLRRGTGRRTLINVAPSGGFIASGGMFPYCSSALAFERLAEVLAEQVKGTSIQCVTIAPKLLRGSSASGRAPRQLYQLQRIDDLNTAERVANIVGGHRAANDRSRRRSIGSRLG